MPAVVILAAGRSTRFGSAKQTTPVGPAGEWLLEFALDDAQQAGFDRAAVVVAPGAEDVYVRHLTGPDRRIAVHVVPQRTGLLAPDAENASRPVPWGTAHAVLAARAVVAGEPFLVVNADDYYGADAYRLAADAVSRARRSGEATLVAMRLGDTLPPHGPVTRALSRVSGDRVVALDETRGLERRGGRIVSADGVEFDPHALVSMNCWVLPGDVLVPLADRFVRFAGAAGSSSREFLLPAELSAMAAEGTLAIRLVSSPGPWFGLTSGRDRPWVEAGLRDHRARKSTTARTRSAPNDSDSSL